MDVDLGTKPFLVTFSGSCFGYWLLDPPDDRASPLVKNYLSSLKSVAADHTVLLANTFELTAIVDEAICATQDYKQTQKIIVSSQCNRFMKHVQVSAIYFSHYEAIGCAIVKHLHLAMRRLFESRPSDEASGKQILLSIFNVTSAVMETARTRLNQLKKLQDVMRQVLSEILDMQDVLKTQQQTFAKSYMQSFYGQSGSQTPTSGSSQHESEEIKAIRKFIDTIVKSSTFWEHLFEVFKKLTQLTSEIENKSVKTATRSVLEFEEYKRNVIKISSNWIAIRRMCTILKMEITAPQLQDFVQTTIPNNLINIDEFNEFACNVNVHFDDLESLLMTTDFNMQNEVAVYSTWVKPVMNASFPKCLETVEHVNQLVKQGKVRETSRKIVEVMQQSRRVKTITEVYVQRLEELEKYAVRQQENLMKKMDELEKDRNRKRVQIQEKRQSLASKQREVQECRNMQAKAEENKNEAERKKRDAERRKEEVRTWWWVPVWGQILCIRELIEDNSSKINAEERRISRYQNECLSLESKIQSVESEISNLNSDVWRLSSRIDNLQDELKKRIAMLKEMREATATLKQSVYNWKEFTTQVDHGIVRSGAMAKLVTKASNCKDPARILRSGGTQTTMKSFTEAFQSAERILQNQWQYMVSYDYICVLCGCQKSGLPLPVNEETVVCNECAHKYVE